MPVRPCSFVKPGGMICGQPTRAGARCADHRAKVKRQDTRWVYRDPRWAKVRRWVLHRHRQEWGDLCLGDGKDHERHLTGPDNPLSIDHLIPLVVWLAQGRDPFDVANLGVKCRSWNSAKDAGWAGLR